MLHRRRSCRRPGSGWPGPRCATPAAAGTNAALAAARTVAPLVLVTADVAARIDAAALRAALSALAPLVLIVPDAQGEVPRSPISPRACAASWGLAA